jgi:hypothetical protein
VANQFANLATVEPGALPGLAVNLLPAGVPQLATSGTGGVISAVAESVGNGPPKLPGVLAGQNTLTAEQRREATRRAIAQTNRELAEENEPLVARGSTGGPSTQQIVKEE